MEHYAGEHGGAPTFLPNAPSPPSHPPPVILFYGRTTRLRSVGKGSLRAGLDFHNLAPFSISSGFLAPPFSLSAGTTEQRNLPRPRCPCFRLSHQASHPQTYFTVLLQLHIVHFPPFGQSCPRIGCAHAVEGWEGGRCCRCQFGPYSIHKISSSVPTRPSPYVFLPRKSPTRARHGPGDTVQESGSLTAHACAITPKNHSCWIRIDGPRSGGKSWRRTITPRRQCRYRCTMGLLALLLPHRLPRVRLICPRARSAP